MRRTSQRQAILGYLARRRDHLTVEEIHAGVRGEIPSISLATVYRNLSRLVEEGLVQELHSAGHGKRYDSVRDSHHHFFCTNCGRVEDVYPSLPPSVKEAMFRSLNHEVIEFRLQFFGLCKRCAESRASEVQ